MEKQNEKFTVTLSKQQLESFHIFLERTELRGREVPRFIELVQAVREAINYETQQTNVS